jgi:dephospho-CoA kinase
MIIGITGTDGAGKGAAVDYLVKTKGFTHYSSRALIIEEIEARGLPVNREQMRLVANDMRRERGLAVMVETALEKMRQDNVANAVIESIRAVKEVDALRAAGGILLAVDADREVRYKRIVSRHSASDEVTFEDFVAQEELEMNDPDPNGMQKAAVMALADRTIMNNGTMTGLWSELEQFLQSL